MALSLDTGRWRAVSGLLDRGLELDPASREAWLASLTGPETELVPLLRDLFARSAQVERECFLEAPPSMALDALSRSTEFAPGATIGPYRLLRIIGSGGMGEVWLAERADGSLQRAVALKLPLVALSRAAVAERFARERDILAALEHPHIARLYDAGVATDGQPFLALEYVDGVPIDRYCDLHRLGIAGRLRLFEQVLDAVAYAHASLVLHRDLKPTNILVTAAGEVKLLDFGIAKLVPEGTVGSSALTRMAGRVLTPEYAAPEQFAAAPLTIAADVYSLGVVLHELLTGERPYRVRRAGAAALEEAITRADVTAPSNSAISAEAATARGSTVTRLKRTLRGDLDTIVGKALRLSPGDRYDSARALADDLVRYRSGLPVLAQPDVLAYRAAKFVARHRGVLGVTALVAVILVGATLVSLHQAQVARLEARRASAVQTFVADIFRANGSDQDDPVKARQTTALQLLDLGSRKIETGLADAPEARLETLDLMASLYDDLEVGDRAQALRRQSVALAKRLFGDRDPRVAAELIALDASMYSGRLDDRLAVLDEAKGILDAAGDASSIRRARLFTRYADVYNSTDRGRALSYIEQSITVLRKLDEPDALSTALFTRAQVQEYKGDSASARASVAEAIAIVERPGRDRVVLPRFYTYQGEIDYNLQYFAEAEASFRHALDVARAQNGEDHVDTLQIRMRLGRFLFDTGRTAAGLEELGAARAIALRLRGPDDPFHTTQTRVEYGWGKVRYGELAEGVAELETAVANRRLNRPGTQYLAAMLDDAAYAYVDLGRYDVAQRYVDESRAIKLRFEKPPASGFNHNSTVRARLALALGHPEDAQRALADFVVHDVTPGGFSLNAVEQDLQQADVALAKSDFAHAAALAHGARERILASSIAQYMPGAQARAEVMEGRALVATHDAAAALPLLSNAAATRRRLLSPASPLRIETEVALAGALDALGRPAEAQQAVAEARDVVARNPELAPHWQRAVQQAERLARAR